MDIADYDRWWHSTKNTLSNSEDDPKTESIKFVELAFLVKEKIKNYHNKISYANKHTF